jgi:hypothetical protein
MLVHHLFWTRGRHLLQEWSDLEAPEVQVNFAILLLAQEGCSVLFLVLVVVLLLARHHAAE